MTPHRSPYAMLRRVDPQAVAWTRGFWAEKFALCKSITLPSMRQALADPQNAASWDNLYLAAGLRKGEHRGLPASDGDCFKWLEAVAHAYSMSRDPELNRLLDQHSALIAQAQADDGYISTAIQLAGGRRWASSADEELYNIGHLITAACVHYQATGKTSLLSIAVRAADLLYRVFAPRPPELVHLGFTSSQMTALVDLYRATGDRRYLALADIFVTNRGQAPLSVGGPSAPGVADGSDETQDRVPLRRETEAVGHVVAATSLYCAAADIYAETGEQALRDAVQRIWQDVAYRKLSITGGVGAHHGSVSRRNDRVDEAFGLSYQLPNATAYNETCANIGFAMWNWRMLGICGDARYADALEQTLYNAVLSGIAVDGAHFLYTNPLRWYGPEHDLLGHNDRRSRWTTHTCYCCPPNLARTLAGLHNWVYSLSDEGVWVHLYAGSRLSAQWGGQALVLHQETEYPWDGAIRITVDQAPARPLALMLRIPGWAAECTMRVNGETIEMTGVTAAYARLARRWAAGDTVDLSLPMPVRLLEAHPRLEEARNQVAVQRGPIVYCLEECDLPAGLSLAGVRIPRHIRLSPRHDAALLGGVTVIEGSACYAPPGDWHNHLYRPLAGEPAREVAVRLIPYYCWHNRGDTPMSVWLPVA